PSWCFYFRLAIRAAWPSSPILQNLVFGTHSLRLREPLGVVTGDQPASERAQGRPLDTATVSHIRAAGRENAAFRRVEGGGQFAFRHDPVAAHAGRRRQQSLRIGVQWRREDAFLWAVLH